MNEKEIEEIKSIIKWTRSMGLLHEANLLIRILDLYNKEKEKNKELENMILNPYKTVEECYADAFNYLNKKNHI